MEGERKPDFSGWATRAGLKCADGRTIMPDAFKHQHEETIPLVWQHNHATPENVLGHAVLEHREEGVYAYAFFNDTDHAQHAKTLVEHEDIKSLSIYANGLTEKAKQVFHGFIRELSLVLSGANPGALIDNITIAHGNGDLATLEDEAIIYTGIALHHAEPPSDGTDSGADSEEDGPTIQEIYDGMTEEEKAVVHYMVGAALETAEASHSDDDGDDFSNETDESDEVDEELEVELMHHDNANNDEEGQRMTRNVFEQQNGGTKDSEQDVLSHDAIRGIVEDARKIGSLKEAVEAYAFKHGIDNIETLFPDAQAITNTPEFDQRRVEWVKGVMEGTRHSPFSRIKSLVADITFDEARAKGYVKGNMKKEEWFGVSKRVTTPTTVYKKQKLDRDDIIDITDMDVVAWLKAEMRLMLDEELARAVLIGDGRDVDDEDKVRDPAGSAEGAGIRSILHDHDLYAATVTVDDGATSLQVADEIIGSIGFYKGSGSPIFYTTLPVLTSMLVTREPVSGQRYWRTKADLAAEMGVSDIVTVEVMEDEADLIGIIVNLRDYTMGADKGGDVNLFDDFDIDYNQYKYLLETRLSGALTKIRSAIVIKRAASGATLASPQPPTLNQDTGVVTINAVTGITYKNAVTDATLTGTVTLADGDTLNVVAVPNTGYYLSNNVKDQWTIKYTAS
jgi:hypothetical protein